MSRIIVVGAGPSGLATASFLAAEKASNDIDVQVFEASDQVGGNVRSDREGGRILDRGANGWLDDEPAMDRLLELLGLTDQVVRASDRSKARWIWARGEMHPAPLSPPALLRSRLLGWRAKLRLLGDLFANRGPADRDESVADFVRRRLGTGVLDNLVAPMVAGIHATTPELLSLRAAFPRMYELEREHRSLILAMLRLRRGGAPSGHLCTLPGGVGALPAAMADRLGSRVRTGVRVTAVERRRDHWVVHTVDGAVDADGVVLAAPAPAQAGIVRGLDPELAATLEQIPYVPVTVVVTAFPRGAWAHEPDGFGVLMARGETGKLGGVLGTVFSSCVFPHQSREDEVLLRTLFGGTILPEAAAMDDQQLLCWTRKALSTFFGEEREAPTFVRIYRWRKALPGYRPGHLAHVRAVRAAEARHPGLFLTGNHLNGVAIKDCVRSGEATARRARSWVERDA